MQKVIVTTSWDDGHILDIKLAHLLRKYHITGTFYIAPEDCEIKSQERLNIGQLKELSNDFEIGAHTMTHPHLTKIDDASANKEIAQSKTILEKITGKPVTSFCYPAGIFDERHAIMVRNAGFKLARTVERFATNAGNDPFILPTTVHAYRHWSDIAMIFQHDNRLSHFIGNYLNWDNLAISLFENVLKKGGAFHLWGHSWEIEKNNDWTRLERVLSHISNNPNVQYKTNAQLI